jgi:putative DNA primase/helicase
MIEILNAIRATGLEAPDTIIADAKVHRYGSDAKKSHWYIAFQNHTRGGELFYVAQFGSHKTQEVHNWQSNVELSADDAAFVQKKMKEATAKAKAEKETLQKETAERCSTFWETISDVEIPPYCQRKKMRELFGARSKGSDVFVPMRDVDGKLWGLQRIQENGAKFFSPGQRVSGVFHSLGTLDGASQIYVAEGFATGASIYQALERPVVVAFNAGNLVSVTEAIRKKYPESRIVVCADNDAWTESNPGKTYAEKAASKVGGTVAMPRFQNLETKPTDFNDLHLLEGLDAVRDQIAPIIAKKNFVVALGFSEKEYFFTSSSNEQIVPIRTFSEVEFYNLMPREYWESAFPAVKGGIDFVQAKSELMEICRDKGIFETRLVRGSGIWLDEGRTVLNLGDHLIVDGNRMAISEIKSRFFYTRGRSLPELGVAPLSVDECDLLVQISDTFKWQRREFGPLCAGALVISKLCGALPIRPHIWITGGSQTGKSTLQEQVIFKTLKGHSLYFLGGSTEAGLRQALKSDSVPIIFDEFETNGPKSSEKIQECVELMRAAWSESSGVIAKGSAGGNATYYQPRFSAIVSSIRVNLANDADRSRFTCIELAPHGSDPDHWKKLSGLLAQYSDLYVSRLYRRTLGMIPTILGSYEVFRRALAQKVGARFGQQYGMLLAGYWALISDDVITASEASGLIASFDLNEEQDEARLTDELELVSFLATTKIRTEAGDKSVSSMIGASLKSGPMDLNFFGLLEANGIKVESESVSIASNHAAMRDLLKQTRWANCWPKTLSRLEGAKKNSSVRIGGKVLKATKLPLTLFIDR